MNDIGPAELRRYDRLVADVCGDETLRLNPELRWRHTVRELCAIFHAVHGTFFRWGGWGWGEGDLNLLGFTNEGGDLGVELKAKQRRWAYSTNGQDHRFVAWAVRRVLTPLATLTWREVARDTPLDEMGHVLGIPTQAVTVTDLFGTGFRETANPRVVNGLALIKAEGEWGEEERDLLHRFGEILRRIDGQYLRGRGQLDEVLRRLDDEQRRIVSLLRAYKTQKEVAVALQMNPKTLNHRVLVICELFEVTSPGELTALLTPKPADWSQPN